MKNKNSVFKKALSVLLTALLLFGTVSLGIVFPETKITADALTSIGDVALYAPEAVYLYPNVSSWKESTSSKFQYYVDNNVNTSDFSQTPTPKSDTSKTSTVYFNYPNLDGAPSILYRWVRADGTVISDSSAKINYNSTTHSAATTTVMTSEGSYYKVDLNVSDSVSPSLSAQETGCYIEWVVSFKDSVDGRMKKAVAYTYVYKPYVVPVGASGQVRCTNGKDHDNSQITWISGVHKIAKEAPKNQKYPNYVTTSNSSGINGLAAFLSKEDISETGILDRNTVGKKEIHMYFPFYNTDGTKSYAHVSGYGKADPWKWMGNSSDTGNIFDKASFSFRYWKEGDNITMTEKDGGVGGIYIDTSRYNNLNQIPNLGVGMMMTDNKDTATSDDGAWIIGDYTDYAGNFEGDNSQGNGDYMRGTWKEFNHVIAGEGDPDNRNKNYDTCCVKYAGAWTRSLTTASSQTYKIKACQMNNQNKDWITVTCIVSLDAVQTDKSVLRSAVKTASAAFAKLSMITKYDSAYYREDEAYTTFINYYKQAYMELTKVDGGVTKDLAANLLASMDNLNIEVRLHGNGAPDTSLVVTTGINELVEKNVTELGTPVYKGYTFKGWTLTETDGSATDGITSGTLSVGPRQKDVYATWSLNTYTATFRAMPYGRFGSSDENLVLTYTVNDSFTVPVNYTRDYYTFNNAWKIISTDSADWTMNYSLEPGHVSESGKIGNIVLEPNTTPITYTVKFETGSGSTVDDKLYNVESTDTLPSSSRTGFSFIGWAVKTSDDPVWEVGKTYSTGYSLKGMHGNVTLEAQWKTLTSKITLELGEGESISGNTEITYSYDSATVINSPVKKGYTFTGWYVKSRSGENANWPVNTVFALEPGKDKVTVPGGYLGDVVLTPQWTLNTYTLNYESNGGTVYESVTFNITTHITLNTPVKNGYDFAGWSVTHHDSDYNWTSSLYGGGQQLNGGMYGSVTLSANWVKKSYTVTFDANGGSVPEASLPYDIESGTPHLPTASKNGYEFKCWRVESFDAGSSWTVGTEYKDSLPANHYGNVTLKAVWTPKSYTITFSDGQTKTYTVEQTVTLHAAELPGYAFKHWTVTSTNGNWGTEGTIYTANQSVTGKYGNVILTAEFTPCEYTVEFQDENGVELKPTQTYKTGDTVTLPEYTQNGCMFDGWTVISDSGNWGVGSKLSGTVSDKYGNVVFKPSLTAIEYTITFDPDGGTPVPPLKYTIEDTLELSPTAKFGYDFNGWKVDAGSGNWNEGDIAANGTALTGKYGNVTLKAIWTPKIYNITFITGQGEQIVHSSYGQETPTLPGDYSKPADAQYTYTFSHWEPQLAPVTGEATYTAVYTEALNEYTVTWRIEQTENTGDYITEDTVWKYGETPAYNGEPVQAAAPGADYKMRFDGWEPEIVPVTGNKTYTAKFIKIDNPQTVKWFNGSTLLASAEWGIGEHPSYSGAAPTRDDENGYKFVFVGWAETDGGEKLDEPLPAIEKGKDVSYFAVFVKQPQSYTLTLDADGGTVSGGSSISYTYNEANTEIDFPVPVKTGYTFKGWRVTDTDGTWEFGEVYSGSVLVNAYGNASLTALWEKITYTLTFAGEGVPVSSMTYDIESEDVLPDAEKEGSELIGWLVSSGDGSWIQGTTAAVGFALKGSHGNAALTPVYKAKTYTIRWISGETVQEVEVLFGSAIYVFEPIAKQGYTAEWDKEVPATMPAHDLEFVAVYKPIEYFLRLNLNGGTGAESFYYNSDTDMTLPTPTREGATFLGWRVMSSAGNWNVGTLAAGGMSLRGKYGNTILTAQWQLAVYKVTWVAGDETRVTRWYHGMTPSFDGTPYKSPDENYSYIFVGWDKEIVPVDGDVTYTALFDKTERVYTIKWNVDGVITEQSYSYGDTPVYGGETPARPSTPEYDFFFDGWSPDVTAVTDDVTYVAQFRVFVKLQGLSLNKSALFLNINESESLTANIYPATASAKDVIWSSTDNGVATVDAVGRITAVNAGIAIISVSSGDGSFKSYCIVEVSPKLTTTIEITAKGVSTTNAVGNSVQLYATVMPDDATDRTFRWSSDNPGIASVDEFGMVRFNSKGTTVIRAVTTDGYAKGSIEVTAVEVATEEQMKNTYTVRFLDIACEIYLLDDNGNKHTFGSNEVVCVPEGATIRFTPSRPYYVYANGIELEQTSVYVLENIQKNYIISTAKVQIERPDDKTDAPTFIRRLQEFFRKIIQFFKKLFGG